MNGRKCITVSIMLAAIAACAMADDDATTQSTQTTQTTETTRVTKTERVETTDEVFHGHELGLQTFGTYSTRDREGNSVNALGGGLGLTYFFSRYVGIGADSYIDEWKWPYRVNGSAILRLPLPDQFSRLGVYGFGGGGREFKDIPQYTWHGGGGMEYRINHTVGIFADGREVFPDKTPDYTLVRAGLNFVF